MTKKEQRIKEISQRSQSFEKELISKILFEPIIIPETRALIAKEDFRYYGAQYENLVQSFLGKKDLVMEFNQATFSVSEFMDYHVTKGLRDFREIVRDVKQTNAAWKLFTILEVSLENVPDEGLYSFASEVQRGILENVRDSEVESSDVDSVIKSFKERQSFYKEKFENGGGIIGLPTGYNKLDAVIDGFRPEHLWVIGGYSNLGKTSASLNFVSSLVKQQKRVVFYSLEMSKIDILSKLVGIMTKQTGLSVLKGYQHDEASVEDSFKKISESNMSIHNNKYDMAEIEFSMYDEQMKCPVDLFVIDFIQLVTVKGSKSEYETTTSAILSLQQAAKRLKVPIIVLSQISNEGAKSSSEVVMSFKGSGAIAAAADLAIEIQIGEDKDADWKMKLQNGESVKMKWNIRKNRHGKVGYLDMDFTGSTGIFTDADKALDNFTLELRKK